ncbi:Protein NLRC5 [Holothuria leucospilota]|uniref:Protein NLRC5 n=1 Tax=Holothuria leucospilota TaxID=206669 RepID=A0A9Q1HBU6_HOLLE|nr:Protein NLRC5 [Holothuria leucospilota]
MTPVPWKRSCQWKSTDLFVGSGLILTDSKAKQSVQNIDEQCKLNYTEILRHEKLKSESRIILEGDPGSGKTMLSSQLAYDWSQGMISDVDILILLPLKFFEDKTLIQAVKEFYIPTNMPLSEMDIENILASTTERICFLLDGLEEYSTGGRHRRNESSELMKIIYKEKHSNCKVVITTRSGLAQDLPTYPLLKIGRFGETERNSYIRKLSQGDSYKQQKIKSVIQNNRFILDLCSVPLLFVLAVHNIESMSLFEEGQLNKISPFMRSIILTLCSETTVKHEVDGKPSDMFKKEMMTLAELAFNGLCKGHQQLSWQKHFMESNVSSFKLWVNAGILVLEEGSVIAEKKDHNFPETTEMHKGFSGLSTSNDIPKSPALSEMLTTALGAPSDSRGALKMVQPHQSVPELESDPDVVREKTARRISYQVPLVVKFLHKVIQEWFAATFFSSMMRGCTSADELQNYVFSQLRQIPPGDLHYVLRFTSYLHPQGCLHIMNYLLKSYRKDGRVLPHILNCVFLCFNEHNNVKGPAMRNVVKDVCKEVITIQAEDSRLLQQAKSFFLEYASRNGVSKHKHVF